MTEPAHNIEWSPDPVLNTDAVTIIETADHLEQRRKKPTHTVTVEERFDEVMRERIREMFGAI